MTALTDYDLKPADVEFLLTVQDLESNPQKYDNTEQGKAPANVSAIREETSLTKSQVVYRSRDGDNGRGFAEDEMGLLRVHPPTVESGSFGPRSVELTDKGRKVVSEVRAERTGATGEDAGATSAEVNELEQQVSELQDEVEKLSESLAQIQRSQMGAVDSDLADRLNASLRLFPRHQFVLSEIMGIDLDLLADADDLDTIDVDRIRRDTFETLSGDGGGGSSGTTGDDPSSLVGE